MKKTDVPHEVKNSNWNHLVFGNLLEDFLSNGQEMLWAVDKNKKIILANEAYKDFVYELTGVEVKLDDPALPESSTTEMVEKWDDFYTRALTGEQFNVITNYMSDHEQVMMDTRFVPIVYSDHIMGTACIARNSRVKKTGQMVLTGIITQ